MTRTRFTIVVGLMTVPLLFFSPGASAQTGSSPDPSAEMRPAGSERFRNFVLDAAGPVWLVEALGWAGLAQANDTPTEWGRGAKGFGKRYASLLGQGVIQEGVTYGLSEAMALDSRFHKSKKHGFLPRAGDALLQAVTSRRANGDRIVSAPLLAGYAAGGIGMMTWFPEGYTYKDGFRYGGLALASRAGINLIREFILRR
jgi:hypothetical protein